MIVLEAADAAELRNVLCTTWCDYCEDRTLPVLSAFGSRQLPVAGLKNDVIVQADGPRPDWGEPI